MTKKPRATIHDIAKKLNITASTVSRALNNNPRISEGTKKAVQRVAKQLNYQPNSIAAALRQGKSHIIGVIVPTADRSFFASVVRGIEEVANKLNYKVIICQSYDIYEKEVQTMEMLINTRVDGILASIGKNTENFEHFKQAQYRGVPLILFDRTTDELDVSQVMIDDFQGAYKVVQHLIEQGSKRIAHFTSPKKISIYRERLRGYKEALQDHGLPFDESLVIESNMQLEGGRQSMQHLIETNNMPDGVFSASDYGVMGAMQVLKEHGIKIPEQVALAGFSNEPFTSFTEPPLTTVDQHSITMGRYTAEVFFDQLKPEHQEIKRKTVLPPQVIFRGSSIRKKEEKVESPA